MNLDESSALAARFEESRKHLHAVAYRMLGSLSEAEDAVQEAWLRLSRSDTSSIGNLAGWLTTVVARICLDMLRARRARPEQPDSAHVPDPVVDPEHEAAIADSISLALLVVLDTLTPAERLAFVLHDMFEVPFDDIAPIVGKSPAAARQIASRARRRVRGLSTPADADLGAQQEVVAAFLAAARGGDFAVRGDLGVTSSVVRGAESAAKRAIEGARLTATAQLVLVNGAPGYVSFTENGEPRAVIAFTVNRGRVTEINVLADPERLRQLRLASN
jgi:RNA polymerase sigma-70 factor (ECF subfamily)